VIQSLANQPMEVQVELISGRGRDVFLNQADPADTARLTEKNRQSGPGAGIDRESER
jgi:hypothetical protein